jgi:hypothetical protein
MQSSALFHTTLIPVLGKLKQEDLEFESAELTHGEFMFCSFSGLSVAWKCELYVSTDNFKRAQLSPNLHTHFTSSLSQCAFASVPPEKGGRADLLQVAAGSTPTVMVFSWICEAWSLSVSVGAFPIKVSAGGSLVCNLDSHRALLGSIGSSLARP